MGASLLKDTIVNHLAAFYLYFLYRETEVTVKVVGVKPENILLLVHEVFEGLITDFFQGIKYEYHLPCMDCIRVVRLNL